VRRSKQGGFDSEETLEYGGGGKGSEVSARLGKRNSSYTKEERKRTCPPHSEDGNTAKAGKLYSTSTMRRGTKRKRQRSEKKRLNAPHGKEKWDHHKSLEKARKRCDPLSKLRRKIDNL